MLAKKEMFCLYQTGCRVAIVGQRILVSAAQVLLFKVVILSMEYVVVWCYRIFVLYMSTFLVRHCGSLLKILSNEVLLCFIYEALW